MKLSKLWVAMTVVLLATGCATSRSVVDIDSPVVQGSEGPEAGSIHIESVTDTRVFEEAPRDPSIPSLGFGGAASASDEIKARAIGRKRNSYGAALGDVLLPEGETVEAVIREHAAAAFNDAGWQVVEGTDADVIVAIQIDEFWAWFRPGFWAITLNSNVRTTLTFVGLGEEIPVEVHVDNTRQAATEGAWKEIVEMALEEYRRQLGVSVPQSG